MSYYMCPCCLKIYKGDFLNSEYKYCPDVECMTDYPLFEIDELMIYPIKTLLRKGYYTKYCCSGHYFNYDSYIMFEETLPDEIGVPLGWYRDKYCCIRARNNSQADIFTSISNLTEWVNQLQDNKETII